MSETKVGYVYILINGSLPADWLKIGVCRGAPHERAKQLSASSGVPIPFVLAYSRKVRDPFGVESWLHEKLAPHRVNDAREFFCLPLHKAIELVDIVEEVPVNSAVYLETPFSELFATFPDDGLGRELTLGERNAINRLTNGTK